MENELASRSYRTKIYQEEAREMKWKTFVKQNLGEKKVRTARWRRVKATLSGTAGTREKVQEKEIYEGDACMDYTQHRISSAKQGTELADMLDQNRKATSYTYL